ncbi:Ig-like domain-containing protein [Aliiroseovarius crassostreae]|uniref:Ig-like domain-containing protein n=1 Tax=Aliiroseovarius crassostreae TaxID=154981 RepID=UPI003C7A27D5
MQAINFIVRDHTGFVQHGSLIESGISDTLVLGDDGAVSLNLRRSDVREYLRAGENLELYLADGRKIVLEGFFAENGVQENRLYLNEDGTLIEASPDAYGHVTFTEATTWGKWSHLDALVFPESPIVADAAVAAEGEEVTQALGLGLLGAGGGAAAGIIPAAGAVAAGGALLGGGGGDDTATGGEGDDDGGDGNGGGTGGTSGATVDNPDTPVSVGGPDDQSITITGTGTPGASVEVTIGDKVQTTTVGDDGTWKVTFDGDNFPGDGNYEVSVSVTDEDGTVHTPDAPSVTIDTTPPEIDVTGGAKSNGVTVNASDHADGVDISGTGEPGASIEVEINGHTHSTTVAGNGSWSVTFASGEIATGDYETAIKITSSDSFGNSSTITETLDVDTVVNLSLNANAKLADNMATSVVDDHVLTHQELSGPDGGLTLTGVSEPGSTVSVKLGNVTRSAVVDGDGNWSVDFSAAQIPSGRYETTMTITSTDVHGNTTSMDQAILVDTFVGDLALVTPVAGDDVINAADMAGNVLISGQVEAGSTVTVVVAGVSKTITTDPAGDGSWSVTYNAADLPSGTSNQTVQVSATDMYGNTHSLPAHAIRIDTEVTDMDVTGAELTAGGDAVALGGSETVNAADMSGGMTFTGTTERGSTVWVSLDATSNTDPGATWVQASVDPVTGEWEVDFDQAQLPAGEGTATITVRAQDQVGNVGYTSDSFAYDTVAPDAPDANFVQSNIDGTFSVFRDDAGNVVEMLNSDGSVGDLPSGFNLDQFYLDGGLPDGSRLVVTEEDAAGNATSTLFVTDTGGAALDLSASGLSDYNIEAIDLLSILEDNTISISEAELLALSDSSNELTIHGGAGDTVNIDGTATPGATVQIDGEDYTTYAVGTDGGTLYIHEDVHVNVI